MKLPGLVVRLSLLGLGRRAGQCWLAGSVGSFEMGPPEYRRLRRRPCRCDTFRRKCWRRKCQLCICCRRSASGAATAPWALENADVLIERALLLSEACQCNVTIRDRNPDLLALVRCLQQAPVSQLLQHEWVTYEFLDFPWTPVVDHYFLTEQPKALLESGQFKKCELLLGSNHDESIYFIVYYVDKIFKRDEVFTKQEFLVDDRLFEQAVYALLPQKYRKNPIVHRAILFEYTDFDRPATAQRRQQALDKMFGDYHFTCGVNEFARRFRDHGSPVYSYYFTQRSSEQQWPEWMGVLHGYEINYVFGEPLNVKQFAYTEAEKRLGSTLHALLGKLCPYR
ncbi:acetylcholinesterase 1, partial [Trichinella spiralis]|uniref:acetylcholinesterase 1 n=1 Tax=Trichinella spiralis TaxID=6334 RepID=UPI0001EFE43C